MGQLLKLHDHIGALKSGPKLAGIYITARRVYWQIGVADANSLPLSTDRSLAPIPQYYGEIDFKRPDQHSPMRPEETIAHVAAELANRFPEIIALGVGSFGPFDTLDIDARPQNPDSEPYREVQYGRIQSLSKHNMLADVNLYQIVWKQFQLRGLYPDIRIQTDVAVSAIAEVFDQRRKRYQEWVQTKFGEATKFDEIEERLMRNQVSAFLKVSDGVGGALTFGGSPWPPKGFSELGHIRAQLHDDDPLREGVCQHHKDCIEGLACVASIEARLKLLGVSATFQDLKGVSPDDPLCQVFDLVAFYVAQACVAVTMIACPTEVVLAGEVMRHGDMIRRTRSRFYNLMGREGARPYPLFPALRDRTYIRGPIRKTPGTVGSFYYAATFAANKEGE